MSSNVVTVGHEQVQAVLSWGDKSAESVLSVLSTWRFGSNQPLVIGEGTPVPIPESVLGTRRAEVLHLVDGRLYVRAPCGAALFVDGLRGQDQVELVPGSRVELRAGLFTLSLQLVSNEQPLPMGRWNSSRPFGAVAGSAIAHAALFGAIAFFVPALAPDDSGEFDRDRLTLMQTLLRASADRELPASREQGSTQQGGQDTPSGPRATGSEGSAGRPDATAPGSRTIQRGDQQSAPSAAASRRDMGSWVMFSVLANEFGTVGNGPVAPWGSAPNGSDDRSTMASLFGSSINDGPGRGGLGLSGLDEGGGGKQPWIGLNNIGPLGTGTCVGTCIGATRGPTVRAHTPKGPGPMREVALQVNGRLPQELIQRVIRMNSGRYRGCYEQGLRNNPSLAGRVGVRFVIGRSGAVDAAMDSGSDLPDASVRACVVRAFQGLSFSAPEDGTVTVSYGLAFHPQ